MVTSRSLLYLFCNPQRVAFSLSLFGFFRADTTVSYGAFFFSKKRFTIGSPLIHGGVVIVCVIDIGSCMAHLAG